jgi:hypothetical protein
MIELHGLRVGQPIMVCGQHVLGAFDDRQR